MAEWELGVDVLARDRVSTLDRSQYCILAMAATLDSAETVGEDLEPLAYKALLVRL